MTLLGLPRHFPSKPELREKHVMTAGFQAPSSTASLSCYLHGGSECYLQNFIDLPGRGSKDGGSATAAGVSSSSPICETYRDMTHVCDYNRHFSFANSHVPTLRALPPPHQPVGIRIELSPLYCVIIGTTHGRRVPLSSCHTFSAIVRHRET